MTRLATLVLAVVLSPATALAQHGAPATDKAAKSEKPTVADHVEPPVKSEVKKEPAKPAAKESPKETAKEGAKEPAKGTPEAAVAEIMRRLQQEQPRGGAPVSSSRPPRAAAATRTPPPPPAPRPRLTVSWRVPVTWPAELLAPPAR